MHQQLSWVLMNKVFQQYLDRFVIVFIDDILVYSMSKEEHERHLTLVLRKLREHRLYAKFSKGQFWLKGSGILGSCHFSSGHSSRFSKDSSGGKLGTTENRHRGTEFSWLSRLLQTVCSRFLDLSVATDEANKKELLSLSGTKIVSKVSSS